MSNERVTVGGVVYWRYSVGHVHALEREVERLQKQNDALNAQFRGIGIVTYLDRMKEQQSEIERLRAIVGRLPKTADGVPITPGAVLYDRCCGHAFPVTGFNTRDGVLSCLYGDSGFDAICSGYYSTREAAEKARSQQ